MNRIRKILSKMNSSVSSEGVDQQSFKFPGGLFPMQETNPEDVFIVGFPKSGNTLMQHIITHLVYGINKEISTTMVLLIVPDVYASSHYYRFNSTCFFKSHERPQPNYKKVIYLLRDGRESLLSYYHMVKNMGGDIKMEDLYSGKISIHGGTWHEHINEWKKNPYGANILFVKYEDLITNKMEVLLKLCDFLSLERTNEELKEVVDYTSFNFMKNLEKNEDWTRMKNEVNFNKGNFVRKGSLDSFKEEVPEELLQLFIKNSKNTFYNFQ